MTRDKIVVKVGWTGKRVKPIDIPNDVSITVLDGVGATVLPEESENISGYIPSKQLIVTIADGNLGIVKLDGCTLIVKDGDHEVEFQ